MPHDELRVRVGAFKKMHYQMYWWNHCMEDARGTKPMPIYVQLMIRSFGCGGDESNLKCSNEGQGTQFYFTILMIQARLCCAPTHFRQAACDAAWTSVLVALAVAAGVRVDALVL